MKLRFRISIEKRLFQKELELPCLTQYIRLRVGDKFIIFFVNLKNVCWDEEKNNVLLKHRSEDFGSLLSEFGSIENAILAFTNDPKWKELVY